MMQISLPYSKSIAARALICRVAMGIKTKILNLPDCDDIRYLSAALEQLRHSGCERVSYDLGSGAAPYRFFVALVASMPGKVAEIHCSPQLAARPIMPLIDALKSIGADIEVLESPGSRTLLVRGCRLRGGVVNVDSSFSSQFASALLLASPLWERLLRFPADSLPRVSAPYFVMTQKVMNAMAANPGVFRVEADWSAAAFFYEYNFLHPHSQVSFANLDVNAPSLQGDARVRDIFKEVGECVDINLADAPDLVPALTVAFALHGVRFRFSGVGHLRFKESNRIDAMIQEMKKIGFRLAADEDSLFWKGERCHAALNPVINPHADHRIAMAFGVAADLIPGLTIANPEVVAKSFPDFFEVMRDIRSK